MTWLPALATAALYCLVGLFPDAPLAFYIGRGWLGVLAAWALWRGLRITWVSALSIAVWEGATSVCGALYATDTPAIEGLCTRGTGLPFAWPALALTVAAVLSELAPRRG